ncbi:sulfite exporter TauE/SafE family protein [Pontibacillus yanchengensis]|uniref:Probable membrane transporter protein n=1 Tax=Pontibacillus yanchengensis Y32 TaxID=1385514 RepID=A0A0A2T9N9_9BACI|nr:sulfite exporter TauE/SafE family protein [Pontibacillus yanchengensis]KGP72527.1 membrane protein [Pontibacillus yanchengensis Y32]
MIAVLIIIIGFFTAFIGSIAGIGGGTILVPSLLFLNHFLDSFSWVTPQKIVGISLIVMVFTGLSSTISYLKSKRIDYKSGVVFLVGSIPGGILGSWLNQFIEVKPFTLLFGILMIIVSSLFFLRKRETKPQAHRKGSLYVHRSIELDGHTYHYSIPILLGALMAFGVGILSGLFGIGGGSLMVPAMILLFRVPPHIATATSMFMIFFMSLLSSTTHILLGHVAWFYTLLFIPGAWVGGTLGAKVNQRMKSETIVWTLRILLILIGIRLIWEGIG